MRYTVLLTPETDPDVYVAYVPVLGVVTQGATIEAALTAAREAATVALAAMVDDGEDVPIEPTDGVIAAIDVPVPVPAVA